MKFLKKISVFTLVFVALFVLTGCGKEKNIEGNLTDLMDKLYADIPEEERPMMLMNTEVNAENIEYYLGTADIEYKEALASEPGVTSIAHSIVLVRVKEGADVEKVKTKIKENVKPDKWLCTSVEKDKVVVKNRGDLIILIMTNSHADKIEQAFDNL